MEITKQISNFNHYKGNKVEAIIIHYVGAVSTAKNNADFFGGGNRNASAHYFVDDNEIRQVVEDYNGAWHIGDSNTKYNNKNTIGIEQCCVLKDGKPYVSEKTEANTVELVKKLLKTHNLSANVVLRHKDVSGKLCPNWSDERWNNFKSKLTTTVAPPVNTKIDVFYQVYANGRWLPEVKNLSDYAGIDGQRIQGIKCRVSKGDILYRVRLTNGKWLPWVRNHEDYAGIIGQNIDCIQIRSQANSKKSKYRVRLTNGRYLPWVTDYNTTDDNGYAGINGYTIDRLEIELI